MPRVFYYIQEKAAPHAMLLFTRNWSNDSLCAFLRQKQQEDSHSIPIDKEALVVWVPLPGLHREQSIFFSSLKIIIIYGIRTYYKFSSLQCLLRDFLLWLFSNVHRMFVQRYKENQRMAQVEVECMNGAGCAMCALERFYAQLSREKECYAWC